MKEEDFKRLGNLILKNKELEEEIKKYKKQYIIEAGTNHILTERIDKAIEYIEEATKYQRGMGLEPLDEIYADNIVDILKGDNK